MVRPIQDNGFDDRRGLKGHDGIALPIEAGDSVHVKLNRLEQGPASRLHKTAFQLIAQAIGIHHLTGIRGDDDAPNGNIATAAIHLQIYDDGAVALQILVLR